MFRDPDHCIPFDCFNLYIYVHLWLVGQLVRALEQTPSTGLRHLSPKCEAKSKTECGL